MKIKLVIPSWLERKHKHKKVNQLISKRYFPWGRIIGSAITITIAIMVGNLVVDGMKQALPKESIGEYAPFIQAMIPIAIIIAVLMPLWFIIRGGLYDGL